MINLLERFGEIEAELKATNLRIGIVLNTRIYANEDWYHYLFVYDKKSNVHFVVNIKGFDGLGVVNNIETLEDILKEFKLREAQKWPVFTN